MPTAVNFAALSMNCSVYFSMASADSGTILSKIKSSITPDMPWNTGNADISVAATVIIGTSDNRVVKVRLDAVCRP